MRPCTMSVASAAAARRDWLCSGCNHPRPDVGPVDVTVQDPGPEDPPINFVFGFGIPVVEKAFIESFEVGPIANDLILGKVFREDGAALSDWLTVRGRQSLIVRGTTNVSHRTCSECGRNVYFAMGPRYLFPSPPSQHEIFVSDLSGLIVSEGLLRKLALNKWPKLMVDELPVLDSPRDGIEDLVATYSDESMRK